MSKPKRYILEVVKKLFLSFIIELNATFKGPVGDPRKIPTASCSDE